MRRIVGLLSVFLLIGVFVPSVNAQFDESDDTPSEIEGGHMLTMNLCLTATTHFKCQHIFGSVTPDGSCGGAECDGPHAGCSPTSVIRSNPNWNSSTGTAYREACLGEVGWFTKPKGVNCKVDQQCGCSWSSSQSKYICQLMPSWTVLQSYMKSGGSGATSCNGMADCPP